MARLSFTEVGLLLLLVLALMLSVESTKKRMKSLRRKKREWILPASKLMENIDYTKKPFIAKIRSDKDKSEKVEYFLSGPGADKAPFNLFVVDPDTGFVRITAILDREKCSSYNLTGKAKFRDGRTAEEDIPLIVTVLDMNDNAPWFELHTGNITEASRAGTFVMQIKGNDNDQAGTIHSELFYSIVSQEPEGTGHMFTIDEKTGKLYVKEPTLDRETHDFYKLVIKGTDMGGAAGGLTGTGTVEINVLDINDNIPVLEKSEYTGSVAENVADVVVMRIKALDADLEHTDNWLTIYSIATGNEDDLFSIETDKETNEGILKLIKPVDFEEMQKLELGLLIENVAPFVEGGALLTDVEVNVGEGGPPGAGAGVDVGAGAGLDVGAGAGVDVGAGAGVDVGAGAGVDVGVGVGAGVDLGVGVGLEADLEGGVGLDAGLNPGVESEVGVGNQPDTPAKSYPIIIAVNNMPEDPAFIPDTKNVPVSEDPKEIPTDGVIAVFSAVDPDTGKPAEDVSYAKAYDPDNWFTIDEETAEIKLNKAPDRESPFMVNGTYIAKILAITKDMPSKTATGTIAIKVADVNDHCPTLTTTHTSLCSDVKTVYVTGFDEDGSPNAAPFTFRIVPQGTRGSWEVEVINETSAALHSQEALWPGSYELQVEVLDAQGLSCPANNIFTVEVCTCVETEDCSLKTARLGAPSSELSAPAIGLLLLAMCLLLFIPLLLLFCQCGGANTIFPDQFSDLPFDAKEHLISYHTEGRGENKEVPLQSVPIMLGIQKKAAESNFNSNPSKIIETHQTTTVYDQSVQEFQETSHSLVEVDNTYEFARQMFSYANNNASFNRQTFGGQRSTALYEDIALPDAFLSDYYSQKAACAVPVKDGLLEYDFEGQGSSAGSVCCCSLLESDNDLRFLDDLDPKFKILAEICSPPTLTPKPSLIPKIESVIETTADIVEEVVMPKIELGVESKHADIKTERIMSSTNISKSSISTVSTTLPSVTLPPSTVTNISHSSNIIHSASLPRQAQMVMLQQQPVFYTTSTVLQPMHYVVQPQPQNTILLADGAHGGNFPGLYVVSGPQSPSSGFVLSEPQVPPSGLVIRGNGSPKSPASPTSPVSRNLLLPGGPGGSQCSVPAEGWRIIGPNKDGNYTLVKDDASPGEVEGVDPGSSRGTLPRGATLVKEAAPPQGVLGPAAQSVYGILSGHTVIKKGCVVAVNSDLGQTWVGQAEHMGSGPVNVLEVGQPRTGMADVVTVKPEVRHEVNVSQCQGVPPLEQTALKSFTIDSPNEYKTISVENTFNTPETSKEEVMMRHWSEGDSDIITYTSNSTQDDEEPSNMVQSAFEDNEGDQEYPQQISGNYPVMNFEGHIGGSDSLQSPVEHSDTVIEKIEGMTDVQLNKANEAPTSTFTNVMSQITESNDPQQKAEGEGSEQQENIVSSEEFSQEDLSTGTEISSTESFQSEPDITDLVDSDKENKETSTFPQRGPTSNHINTVHIHGNLEENVGRQEASHLEEEEEDVALSIVEGPEDRNTDVESELQSKEVTEDLDLEEDASPAEKVVSGLETKQVIATSDGIQTVENSEEIITVTRDSHEEVKAEELSTVDEEPIAELQVDHHEDDKIDKGHAKTDIADSEAKMSLQNMSTILINQEDLGESTLTSVEISTPLQVEVSYELTISPLEKHLHTSTTYADHKEEDDIQRGIMSVSGRGKAHVNADTDSISDGEKEENIVAGESQQSFSTSDDQSEAIERQHRMSSLTEDDFISDENITDKDVEERVPQNLSFSDDQDEERANEVNDTSDDNINVAEKVAELSVQQNVSVEDYQDTQSEEEAVSGGSFHGEEEALQSYQQLEEDS